ncbi:MAG: hypothetical protein WC998_10045 [Candidatus Paceibacterota bacterium]|jgi:hypothetical protein
MSDQNAIVQVNNSFIAPVADLQEAKSRYELFKKFVGEIFVEGIDYGKVPGTEKPTLKKPGAEKLGAFFGLRPSFISLETVNDWTGKDHGGEPLFHYQYKCQLTKNGEMVGEGIGSCNSFEKKYRYRWMNELEIPTYVDRTHLSYQDGSISEFAFAIQKAETSGKYGKPAEYWQQFKDAIDNGTARKIVRKTKKGEDMDAYEIGGKLYAVPNRDVADQVNTIDKMAQKRAFVAAILIATNASDYYTQDMEDYLPDTTGEPIIEGQFSETATETFAKEAGAETGELLKYLDAKVVKMVAKVRGLTSEDAAKGLQEWLTNGRIKKEMTLAQFEALAKVD